MNKNDDLNHMLQYAEFYQIKEMLFCMDGLSCSDERMIKIINSHGGIHNYFKKVEERYKIFLNQDKKYK